MLCDITLFGGFCLMKKNLIALKNEFLKIKNMGLVKPLRKGTTGIGYTFESLLNKEEDSECKPDFLGIELKTKFGYSKTPLTLFHCVPQKNNESAINYIFDRYSYPKYNNPNVFIFSREVYSDHSKVVHGYEFRLHVDYLGKEIVMKSYYKGEFLENVCSWDFKTLQIKLATKLKYLAIIEGYPYKINKELFYKYLKMTSYKLKGFFEFLKLIEKGKINILFYLKIDFSKNNPKIENHGVAFRIENDYIKHLFTKIKI